MVGGVEPDSRRTVERLEQSSGGQLPGGRGGLRLQATADLHQVIRDAHGYKLQAGLADLRLEVRVGHYPHVMPQPLQLFPIAKNG